MPPITPMQFMVLRILSNGECSGREIRSQLGDKGVKMSAPSFYQNMARMEDAGLVDGHYEQKVVEGQASRERWYEITQAGLTKFEKARSFYSEK